MYVNTPIIQRCLFILNLLGFSIALPVEADIKCWTTRDGIRECGNIAVPTRLLCNFRIS
jgi:hypothetical protein